MHHVKQRAPVGKWALGTPPRRSPPSATLGIGKGSEEVNGPQATARGYGIWLGGDRHGRQRVCLDDDFEVGITHLKFPLAHRRLIRTMNILERLFGEGAVLKLMCAALIRAAAHWCGLKMTAFERRQLQAIRDELNCDFAAQTAP